MDLKRLKEVLQSETGRDLREFLTLQLDSLKDISNVKEYSKAQDQALELKAQKKAHTKLQQILEQIISFAGSPEKPKPGKNDYGV